MSFNGIQHGQARSEAYRKNETFREKNKKIKKNKGDELGGEKYFNRVTCQTHIK